MEPPFSLSERLDGDTFVIEVQGEIDLSTEPELRAAWDRRNGHGGPLRIDLRGVTFIDSTGIRALVELSSEVEREAFSIVAPPRPAWRAIEVSGLAELLPFVGVR